ncbi:ParB/RepB/Spo0J family partition protein [Dactylosporangium darangshiense]|uniref:ParB N-terminal domain-containing protein n=1 Tax=Dactylosporangium darangshiense TaxID=579108 RepID=A0ABP8DUT1_9ACTN
MQEPRWTRILPDRPVEVTADGDAGPGQELVQQFLGRLSEPQWVPVRFLLPADSPRQSGEDVEHAQMLARVDARLPPIVVHRQLMRVIDGMHRLTAATLRGDEFIEVRFFDGTEHEAFVLAVQTNIAHGLPLPQADRSRAAERIIASHPGWSDRAIAAAVGLSAQTVANIRRRMWIQSDSEVRVRTGRDGRVRPLDGAEGRLRASRILRLRPDASLREVAREAAVSPSTVRDVRRRVLRGEDPVPRPRQRRRLEAPAPAAPPPGGPDLAAVLEGLQNDPELRQTESGRQLLRWIFSRAIRSDERLDVIDKVPPHCTYIIANVARSCAEEWSRLAEHLQRRPGASA